jgi:hypothetical protein
LREDVRPQIASRANHIRESHEEGAPLYKSATILVSHDYDLQTHRQPEYQGADERPDKALNGFLGTQLDQRRSAEELACKESGRSKVVMIGM